MGVNVGTAAFVVVTIGGLGSFWGAILSGLLVGQVVSLSIYFQPRAAEASIYILMAVILLLRPRLEVDADRKSTRLNSSHGYISYAVFCLKKKTNTTINRNSRL